MSTVHLVDDDEDFRDALAWLLDSRGVHTTPWPDGQAFLHGVAPWRDRWPSAVVLLDIRMEPLSGLSVFEQLRAWQCPWPVLFLTGHGNIDMAVQAVKRGAWDFLEKPFQDNALVDKVEAALRATRSAEHQQAQALRQALHSLSGREREVLAELLKGRYNKNIAERLGITERTVEFHRANILQKMGVGSAVELAHLLGRHGLL
jgi:two-component system response regulator DctR